MHSLWHNSDLWSDNFFSPISYLIDNVQRSLCMFKYIPSALKVSSLIITCLVCIWCCPWTLTVRRILCCFLLQPAGLQLTVLGGKRNALLCNIVLQLCKGLGCSWQHSTESLIFKMSTPLKTDNYTIAMRNFASISYLNNVLLSVQVFLFCILSPFRGDETSFSCPALLVSCGEHFILGALKRKAV